MADFVTGIDYGQLVVHARRRAGAGLLWADEDVAQGFVWSEGYVAFGVPDHDGECRVTVEVAGGVVLDPRALWAVQVPFVVDESVCVGTLFAVRDVAVPKGRYGLLFQALPGDGGCAYALRLSFSPDDAAQFRIVKKGGDVTADVVVSRVVVLAG